MQDVRYANTTQHVDGLIYTSERCVIFTMQQDVYLQDGGTCQKSLWRRVASHKGCSLHTSNSRTPHCFSALLARIEMNLIEEEIIAQGIIPSEGFLCGV